jgi:hypothetical protein
MIIAGVLTGSTIGLPYFRGLGAHADAHGAGLRRPSRQNLQKATRRSICWIAIFSGTPRRTHCKRPISSPEETSHVEAYLIRAIGLGELKHICCQCESDATPGDVQRGIML